MAGRWPGGLRGRRGAVVCGKKGAVLIQPPPLPPQQGTAPLLLPEQNHIPDTGRGFRGTGFRGEGLGGEGLGGEGLGF